MAKLECIFRVNESTTLKTFLENLDIELKDGVAVFVDREPVDITRADEIEVGIGTEILVLPPVCGG